MPSKLDAWLFGQDWFADERAKIWKISFPAGANRRYVSIISSDSTVRYSEKLIVGEVKKYQLTGGSLIDVVHFASNNNGKDEKNKKYK